MRLEVFHAADGDCLLLSSGDGHHVLIDGGRAGTFADNTQPRLQELKLAGEAIDLVLVSHIDADHITGILRLLGDVGDWAVFDHQRTAGDNPTFPEPKVPRPPEIRALWHNSWRAQVGELEGPIAALALQVTEPTALDPKLVTSAPESTQLALADLSGLAESIADGVQLSRLIEERTPAAQQGLPRPPRAAARPPPPAAGRQRSSRSSGRPSATCSRCARVARLVRGERGQAGPGAHRCPRDRGRPYGRPGRRKPGARRSRARLHRGGGTDHRAGRVEARDGAEPRIDHGARRGARSHRPAHR